MLEKVLAAILVIVSVQRASAKCFEVSKDFDSCLQCCTDTSQTAELVEQFPNFTKDVYAVCKNKTVSHQVNLASKPAKALYAKYKIDGSTINLICNDGKLQEPAPITLEAYDECVSKCNEQFPDTEEITKEKNDSN